MNDYIKREDAINILCGECLNYKVCCSADGEIPVCPLFWKMQNIPADNVVEVRHGEFVGQELDTIWRVQRCSECHEYVPKWNFCSNCGADMRGTDDN